MKTSLGGVVVLLVGHRTCDSQVEGASPAWASLHSGQGKLLMCLSTSNIICRVVNIAVLVLLPIVSAILSEYLPKYWQYFSHAVSIWVSGILFHLFFGNIRCQYICHQVHYPSLSTTSQ